MNRSLSALLSLALTTLFACQSTAPKEEKTPALTRLITLDPGHFHAALVQKQMYPQLDSTVHVYAPEGQDVKWHLDRVKAYNERSENPTRWNEVVYTGADYFEKMIAEKAGDVVVISGNNQRKTDYIAKALDAGFHVLADKPMVITPADFKQLRAAFETAGKNNKLLYDIMTERYEITTLLQRELSQLPAVFGVLENGTPENPAITKESVHHFYKFVSGKALVRPAWFMDVSQQGEGIVDVTTHLVDLVQWTCFPNQALDTADVHLVAAQRWPTSMTLHQFKSITGLDNIPQYLAKDKSNDTTLQVYANGAIQYRLRGVHAKVSVTWAYKAPEGAGDTHYSILRGTKANLIIRQGAEQQYKPALYIEPAGKDPVTEDVLQKQFATLAAKYPGITLQKNSKGWEVMIPDSYKEGHEAHFARVTEHFLEYLKSNNMPAWEVPNMITKYYTTTQALELARKNPKTP
jgi:predicted dehydrogenase